MNGLATVVSTERLAGESVACPYCSQPAQFLESSASLYRGRDFGPVWICRPCAAWVGCHPGTNKPLGIPADAATKAARSVAHTAFDRLWKEIASSYVLNSALGRGAKKRNEYRIRKRGRTRAYRWLAEQLGITPEDCHIGAMDAATCARVAELCGPMDAEKVRAWSKERGL